LPSTGRRFLSTVATVAFVAFCGVAIGGATPPAPSPTPAADVTNPVVVVYPFEVQGDLPPATGTQLAQIFMHELQSQQDITVRPLPAGVVRANYLSNAIKLGADYYISGYFTPLGDSASLVQQLVSVQTGIQVFSQTAVIQNAGDAQAQASAARARIIYLSGRDFASVDQSDAADASPTPSSDNGSSIGIGNLFGLLKHDKGNARGSGPAKIADVAKPSRIAIVPRVMGGVSAQTLAAATQQLQALLGRAYHTQYSNLETTNVAKSADAMCGTNRNATVVAGSVSQSRRGGFRPKTISTFVLTTYTCFGVPLYSTTQSADNLNDAIAAAVTAYVAKHPQNS